MKTIRLIIFLIPLIALSGCVSKKKYEELSTAKRRSDLKLAEANKENSELDSKLKTKTTEANKLDKDLAKLKEEFNDMKNEMLENNARKTSLIEELNRKLSLLSTNHASAKDSLQSMLARLDKRDKKYKERQVELSKKIEALGGIETALNNYSTKISNVEKFISHNIDKNGIPKTYTMLEGGFLSITFDADGLFKSGTNELQSDGKRVLKIIGSALSENQPMNVVVLANWSDDINSTEAWKKTNEKANVIFSYLGENAKLDNINLHISNKKFSNQKLGTNKHEIAIVLYPELGSITQYAE